MDFASWLDLTFHGFDYAILRFFHGLQSDFLNNFSVVFTDLGSFEFTFFVGALGLILCLSRKTRKVGLGLFFAVVIGILITNIILKPMIMRARPYVYMAGDVFYQWYLDAGALKESNRSFPSGHATTTFAMATVLFLNIKKKFSWIFIVLAFMVAMTRLYLMVHYPTDVIGGIVVGIFAGSTAFLITKAILKLISKLSKKDK